MKIYCFIIAIFLFACSAFIGERGEVIEREFQKIIDAANVQGAILVYDFENGVYHSNDFEWTKKGNLPASTFKIPNSIIALETGVVENDSTLFKWDGEERMLKRWEQDLMLKETFHYSCVPCYQDIARNIGVDKMNTYLDKLDFGTMQVDSSNIDVFWLEGDSKINQFQQIDFLKRFYQSQLPITERTELIMKRMMVVEENQDYTLSGKTGWAMRNGNNSGWFVGYVEVKDNIYFFATNVEPKEDFDMTKFPMIRKDITYKALKAMRIIK